MHARRGRWGITEPDDDDVSASALFPDFSSVAVVLYLKCNCTHVQKGGQTRCLQQVHAPAFTSGGERPLAGMADP